MTFIRTSLSRLIALLVVALASLQVLAVQDTNNIFLFDVTSSMQTQGLWEPAKTSLFQTIESQARFKDSNFVVIPFGNKDFKQFQFAGKDYNAKLRKEIDEYFNSILYSSTHTNITDAMKKGFAACKPNMANRIYLLTDGLPNGGDSPQKVAAMLDSWCANHTSARLFYVALQGGVIDEIIKAAIDRCNDAYIAQVQGNKIQQFCDLAPTIIHTDLSELGKEHVLTLNILEDVSLNVANNDSIFNFNVIDGKSVNGKIRVTITPRNGESIDQLNQMLPQNEDYYFNADITAKDEQYYIINPTVRVVMANYFQSKMTLSEPGKQGYELPSAEWHDSFLWSKSSEQGETGLTITPVFENSREDTRVIMTVAPGENEPTDFTVTYNGERLAPGQQFTVEPGDSMNIAIIFNTDAKEGKRYFKLRKINASEIDLIDGTPESEWESLTLRSRYDVRWNPMKTLLFWLAVLLLTALILWLVYVHVLTAKIKVPTLRITGPGSYYMSKSIKGANKVTLTSKPIKQSVLGRIFAGKHIYIKAEQFTPDIEILPAGSKKRIRLRSAAPGWDIFPSVISTYEKTDVVNTQNTIKFTIES